MSKKKKYIKNRWFIYYDTKKGIEENLNFNLIGIMSKCEYVNELEIWCGNKFKPFTEICVRKFISSNGWFIKETKLIEDAKDLKGKKFKIPIIETIIRRKDSIWDSTLDSKDE